MSMRVKEMGRFGIELIKCPLGLFPRTWVMPGDKGQKGAEIALFPLGGTLLLYLPDNYEILVDKGQYMHVGRTILGSAVPIE